MRGIVFGNMRTKTVRTYNYKRGTVTDHRTDTTLPLKLVLDGGIEPFISANRERAEQLKRLAAQDVPR